MMVRHHPPRRATVSNSPLHQAAFSGDREKLQDLLATSQHRRRINLRNHLGCTPLRLAATAGHLACVELLLTHGAGVNIVDIKEQTPLFVAVKENHPACARMLVAHGADPDGSPKCLSTPLYIAAMHGLTDCVQILIKARADVNFCLTNGSHATFQNTPLHISFAYRHRECFRNLLLSGADPNCTLTPKDLERRHSLLDAAIILGDIYYVKLLVEFGGMMMPRNAGHWKTKNSASQKWTSQEFQSYLMQIKSVPRSLQASCRLALRHCLGPRRLASIASLPLPTYLKKYLHHSV